MNELILVVAAPFKKHTNQSLSIKDFEFSLSFDLRWMNPAEASLICDMAIQYNLIKKKDNVLIANFDFNVITIPQGFSPSIELFKDKSIKEQIVLFISISLKMDEKIVISEIDKKQNEFFNLVDETVVALIVAKKFRCDISSIYNRLYDDIFQSICNLE